MNKNSFLNLQKTTNPEATSIKLSVPKIPKAIVSSSNPKIKDITPSAIFHTIVKMDKTKAIKIHFLVSLLLGSRTGFFSFYSSLLTGQHPSLHPSS